MRKNNKPSTGFTLAEVLITLGIIGVVAALTMPSLIQNHRKKQLRAGLIKGYSVIQQALLEWQKDNGEVPVEGTFGDHQLYIALGKYLNVVVYCGEAGKGKDCFVQSGSYAQNPEYVNIYKTYNKKLSANGGLLDDGQMLLSDGSFIMTENNTAPRTLISIDVNGPKKQPNLWGHDLFTFQLMPDGKLLPMGAQGTAYDKSAYCSLGSYSDVNGISCTEPALTDPGYWNELP